MTCCQFDCLQIGVMRCEIWEDSIYCAYCQYTYLKSSMSALLLLSHWKKKDVNRCWTPGYKRGQMEWPGMLSLSNCFGYVLFIDWSIDVCRVSCCWLMSWPILQCALLLSSGCICVHLHLEDVCGLIFLTLIFSSTSDVFFFRLRVMCSAGNNCKIARCLDYEYLHNFLSSWLNSD
jgi:hypothetical protein